MEVSFKYRSIALLCLLGTMLAAQTSTSTTIST
jgi:hypothetical protein